MTRFYSSVEMERQEDKVSLLLFTIFNVNISHLYFLLIAYIVWLQRIEPRALYMLSPYSIHEHSQAHKILYFYLFVVSIVFSLENTILEVC